jgi:N-methylhydantoinase A
MGGELRGGTGAPTFIAWAAKDPNSGNLDRIQMVKGWLDEEGVALTDQVTRYVVDMRFRHQGYEISIEFEEAQAESLAFDALVQQFQREHERLYGFSLPSEVELVNLRARAIGRVPIPTLPAGEVGPSDSASARTGTQRIWLDGEYRDVPLYERTLLQPGMRVDGLSVVAQYDATTLILPGHFGEVDSAYNLLIWEVR